MATISYPNPAIAHQFDRELRESDRRHEYNYSMIISTVLLTLALMALAWCISHCERGSTQANPSSGMARSASRLTIVSNQRLMPGQQNYCHGDMPVLPVLSAAD